MSRSRWEAFVLILVAGFGLILCVHGSKNVADYYTSQHALQKLARMEENIAKAVGDYIDSLEKRLTMAKRFKQDYDSSGIEFLPLDESAPATSSSVTGANPEIAYNVAAHPFRAFRLLRRLVKDLPLLEKELRTDEERKFLKLTEKVKAKVSFPTESDVKGATEGIIRVHDTYNINIDNFASGVFFGLATNTSMSAADCYFIGLYALQATILTRAIEWLEQAYRLASQANAKDGSTLKAEIRSKLEEAISQHNKALSTRARNPYLFTERVSLQSSLKGKSGPRKRLLDRGEHVLHNPQESLMDLTNFASLCGGKELRNQSELSRLKCWYETRQPMNVLYPLKVETHSVAPLVLQLHDLISDQQLKKLVESATKEEMSRSQVHAKSHKSDNKLISSTRTSTSTWLLDDNKSPLKFMNGVYRKLESFTKLKFIGVRGAAEDLQVSCYGIAGHFNPHLDTIFTTVDKSTFDSEEVERGDRLATFMFYLSDVVRGGATAFPRLGIKVEPAKGSVLFWHNMDENGQPDHLTLHGGCPILYGSKCVANKWIRFNSQSKFRQCQST